jgi:hypothetical protein
MAHEKTPRRFKSATAVIAAGSMIIAGAIVAFSSVDAGAKPQYVTKSKPCGSCHPPNNPPKKK